MRHWNREDWKIIRHPFVKVKCGESALLLSQ